MGLVVILTLAIAAGLAASTRGDLSEDMKVSVLMVHHEPFSADLSIFSIRGTHCTRHYG